jgi:hypothetical protein
MEATSPISPITSNPTIKVLFAIHPKVNPIDVLGPMEVLENALHNQSDPSEYISHYSPKATISSRYQ